MTGLGLEGRKVEVVKLLAVPDPPGEASRCDQERSDTKVFGRMIREGFEEVLQGPVWRTDLPDSGLLFGDQPGDDAVSGAREEDVLSVLSGSRTVAADVLVDSGEGTLEEVPGCVLVSLISNPRGHGRPDPGE